MSRMDSRPPDEMKDLILHAATERFAHYGYRKTTIMEIASDCGMSPGNIYRYFENKLEIAAMIVRRETEDNIKKLRRRAREAQGGAKAQLRAFLFENLHITFKRLQEFPRLIEMGIHVVRHKPEARLMELEGENKILCEILRLGREEGIFRVDCLESAAHIIQCAALRFHYPHLTNPHVRLEQLDAELEGLFGFILSALEAGCSVQMDCRGEIFPAAPTKASFAPAAAERGS